MKADNFKIETEKYAAVEIYVVEEEENEVPLNKVESSKLYQSFNEKQIIEKIDTIPEVPHEN